MRLEMFAAAENLDFEKAARLRDELKKLESVAGLSEHKSQASPTFDPYASNGKRKSSARGRGTAKATADMRNSRKYRTR
jgi:excinuclease ABC subunit B